MSSGGDRGTDDIPRLVARLEAEKRVSEALIDSLPGFFYIVDAAGRIVRVNQNVARVTGYSADEVARMHPLDFLEGEDRITLTEEIARTLTTGAGSSQLQVVTRDGRRLPYFFTGRRVELDGQPYVIGIGIDVSERVALEQKLRSAQRLEALGRLAGGIAHDFNNLLTAVLNLASIGLRKLARGQSAEQPLHEIRDATRRAGELTRQLLAFSRQQPLDIRVHDLNEVVAGTVRLLRRIVSDPIRIDLSLHPEPALVRADRSQIEQILLNLSINAGEAMPGGGVLTIRTAVEGDRAVLEVTDTGVGIEPAVQAHVFEPFFSTKSAERGTGLGLATVHGIVQQHGGEIAVSSERGRGATFRVTLPRAEQPLPAPSAGL